MPCQDLVRIISTQGSGLHPNDTNGRLSFLEELVRKQQPALICLERPCDSSMFTGHIFRHYEQVEVKNETVILYHTERVQVKITQMKDEIVSLPYLDLEKLCIPTVEVLASKPWPNPTEPNIIKRFALITWPLLDMTEIQEHKIERIRSLVLYSHCVARIRNLPVLMGGDLRLPVHEMKKMVSSINTAAEKQLTKETTPEFEKYNVGLPTQVAYQLHDTNDLLLMDVHHCKSGSHSDFYLASKGLTLVEPTIIDVKKLLSKQIALDPKPGRSSTPSKPNSNTSTSQHCFYQTDVHVPQRPPRHCGG